MKERTIKVQKPRQLADELGEFPPSSGGIRLGILGWDTIPESEPRAERAQAQAPAGDAQRIVETEAQAQARRDEIRRHALGSN